VAIGLHSHLRPSDVTSVIPGFNYGFEATGIGNLKHAFGAWMARLNIDLEISPIPFLILR